MTGLSKSTFKEGLNCPRALWLHFHRPEEADERFADKATLLGTEVGVLAREYWKGTALADTFSEDDPQRLRKAAEATRRLMSDEDVPVIAEATFYHDSHKCQVDLLKRDANGTWSMVEVKSASNVWADTKKTRIREDYLEDVAFQTWLLKAGGIEVGSVQIMHPDSDYRFREELDLKGYFKFEDVTEKAEEMAKGVAAMIPGIIAAAAAENEPEACCGDHCCSPKCPYLGHCLPEAKSDDSIIWLGGMLRKKAITLIKRGIKTMSDILKATPADLDTSARGSKNPSGLSLVHRLQARGEDFVDEKALGTWLRYPEGKTLYFLDFETCQYPIPRYEGDGPWEQVPTQYSLHVVGPDGSVEHREFLATAGEDPWRPIAESLCSDIPLDAVTVAYNKSFEAGRIKAMASKFPDLRAHLLDMVRDENPYGKNRSKLDQEGLGLIDLIDPFRQGWVFKPAMGGSKSIKFVLPALFPGDPELDYHNLKTHAEGAPTVQNGMMAIEAFTAMESMDDPELIEATRENLLRYCELDTWAMVKIWLRLREMAGFEPLGNLRA